MVKYFNKSKMTVPFIDALGNARSIPAKGSVILSPDEDGSASLAQLVRKAVVIKKQLAEEPVEAPKPVEPVKVESKVKLSSVSDTKSKKASDSAK